MKKGFYLGLSASILWSTFYIVGKNIFGNYSIDPIYLNFLRFFIATIFLISFLVFSGEFRDLLKAIRKNFSSFFILGVSGILSEGALVIASLKYTTAARSCLFASSSPFFTVIISYFITKEALTKRKIGGIFIGFTGIILAFVSRGSVDIFVQRYLHKTFLLGDIYALLSGVCWAVYTVFGKNIVSKYGGFISTTGAILLGTIMLLFLSIILKIPFNLNFPPSIWLSILYLGIFPSCLAYVLWYVGLKYIDSGVLGSFGYVTPLLTTALSYFLLKERANIIFFIGFILVFLALYLVMKEEKVISTIN